MKFTVTIITIIIALLMVVALLMFFLPPTEPTTEEYVDGGSPYNPQAPVNWDDPRGEKHGGWSFKPCTGSSPCKTDQDCKQLVLSDVQGSSTQKFCVPSKRLHAERVGTSEDFWNAACPFACSVDGISCEAACNAVTGGEAEDSCKMACTIAVLGCTHSCDDIKKWRDAKTAACGKSNTGACQMCTNKAAANPPPYKFSKQRCPGNEPTIDDCPDGYKASISKQFDGDSYSWFSGQPCAQPFGVLNVARCYKDCDSPTIGVCQDLDASGDRMCYI